LVRKPGAFAQYRYRDELFPTLGFRQAYDRLCQRLPQRADQEYLRILHVAARTTESEVELALGVLLEAGTVPTSAAVAELVQGPRAVVVPELTPPQLDLSVYDQLLGREVVA
jgi:hypothetical protein